MKKAVVSLIMTALLLSGCSSATLDNAGKDLEDTIANAAHADNKYVQMVKGGYRINNPDVTYDKAFSAFFGTPRWKYFESDDGQDVVEFTGDCTYLDAPVKARMQFVVDEENGTFEAAYLAFNEVPQNNLIMAALIEKAFETADEEATTSFEEDNEPIPADQNNTMIEPPEYALEIKEPEYIPAIEESEPVIEAETETWYRVRKTWADASSQKGAFKSLENAKKCADENPGYSVFDESGEAVYAKAVTTDR